MTPLPPLPEPTKFWPYAPIDGTTFTAEQMLSLQRQTLEWAAQSYSMFLHLSPEDRERYADASPEQSVKVK